MLNEYAARKLDIDLVYREEKYDSVGVYSSCEAVSSGGDAVIVLLASLHFKETKHLESAANHSREMKGKVIVKQACRFFSMQEPSGGSYHLPNSIRGDSVPGGTVNKVDNKRSKVEAREPAFLTWIIRSRAILYWEAIPWPHGSMNRMWLD